MSHPRNILKKTLSSCHATRCCLRQVKILQGGSSYLRRSAHFFGWFSVDCTVLHHVAKRNHLAQAQGLCHHFKMIKFRKLSDDHTDLDHSPLLRAAVLTLRYVQDHGPIGLTKTKAFKRVFVQWAAEHFDWPGRGIENLLRTNKVLNEYDFPPLELLHFLLIHLRLGRHFKGEFRLTKRGAELAQLPGKLFDELIPFYVLNMDHAAYSRFEDRPMGAWDIWLNVINVEADQGSTERDLYAALYGGGADWDNVGWRQIAAFSACVLRPLEWSGLIVETQENISDSRHVHHIFKTPLWRSTLKLDTDDLLEPVQMH